MSGIKSDLLISGRRSASQRFSGLGLGLFMFKFKFGDGNDEWIRSSAQLSKSFI